MPTLDTIPVHAGFRRNEASHVYNEAAFRHFLRVERLRAQRSGQSVYLVLVAISESEGRRAAMTDATATTVLLGLSASVREIDFVGWYVERHVAGAVLPQGRKATDTRMTATISDRVLAELNKRFPPSTSRNLRVRVVRLGDRIRI